MFAVIRARLISVKTFASDTAENLRTQKTQTTAISDSFFLRKIARECRKGLGSACCITLPISALRCLCERRRIAVTPLKSLLLCFAITFATPAQAVEIGVLRRHLLCATGASSQGDKYGQAQPDQKYFHGSPPPSMGKLYFPLWRARLSDALT